MFRISKLLKERDQTKAYFNQEFINGAIRGDLDTMKNYLEKGSDINAVDSTGRTALIYAVYKTAIGESTLDIIEFLLVHHADVNIKTSSKASIDPDCSALEIATSMYQPQIVALLLKDANVESKNNAMLHIVSCRYDKDSRATDPNYQAHVKITKMLLESGANPNCFQKYKQARLRTLLMQASQGHLDDIVSLLLQYGADVKIKSLDLWKLPIKELGLAHDSDNPHEDENSFKARTMLILENALCLARDSGNPHEDENSFKAKTIRLLEDAIAKRKCIIEISKAGMTLAQLDRDQDNELPKLPLEIVTEIVALSCDRPFDISMKRQIAFRFFYHPKDVTPEERQGRNEFLENFKKLAKQ